MFSKGNMIHIAVGLALGLAGAQWWMVGVAFLLKEYGELKYEIGGSIYTAEKQKEMALGLFKGKRWAQWIFPAIAAFIVG